MKWKLSIVVGIVLLAFGAMAQEGKATKGTAPQAAPAGQHDWVVPAGSVERPEDAGVRAHTDIVFKSLDGSGKPTNVADPDSLPEGVNPDQFRQVEMPASLGCLYEDSPKKYSTGCVVPAKLKNSKGPIAGGGGAIALVEAGDDATAASDLAFFDSYVNLPAANFVKIQMTNSCTAPPPCATFGWCAEDALDTEYSHAYASNAAIIMVEACSNSYTDLLAAETEAFDYIALNYDYGEVSNSWGSGEFSSEGSYDPIFSSWGNGLYGYKINAFASAGDSGCGAAYPSSNPWIVSAGGSGVYRNTNGTFDYEGCWAGSGGGDSSYEVWAQTWAGGTDTGPWADFQYPIFGENNRMTPDFGFNADPDSGVWLYSVTAFGTSTPWSCCWGGTSEASPGEAAIVNRANNELSTCYFNPVNSTCFFTNQEDNLLYAQLPTVSAYTQNFYSPNAGGNGCTVAYGWDYCTGVGNPRATAPGIELGK